MLNRKPLRIFNMLVFLWEAEKSLGVCEIGHLLSPRAKPAINSFASSLSADDHRITCTFTILDAARRRLITLTLSIAQQCIFFFFVLLGALLKLDALCYATWMLLYLQSEYCLVSLKERNSNPTENERFIQLFLK